MSKRKFSVLAEKGEQFDAPSGAEDIIISPGDVVGGQDETENQMKRARTDSSTGDEGAVGEQPQIEEEVEQQEEEEEEELPLPRIDARTKRQRRLVSQRLETGRKELQKGLKLAAAFERQKFSRRKKTAGEKGAGDVARLEKEYAAIKALNIPAITEHHLYKNLTKTKSIANSQGLPYLLKPRPLPNDTATLNVAARLFNSNATKTALNAIITDVKKILEVEKAGAGGAGKAQDKSKKTGAEKGKERQAEDRKREKLPADVEAKRKALLGGINTAGEHDEDEEVTDFEGFDDDVDGNISEDEEEDDSDGGLDDDEQLAQMMSRVAGSSDEEEGNNEKDSLVDVADFRNPLYEFSGSEGEGLEDDDEDEESDDDGDGKSQPSNNPKPKSKPALKALPATASYLPSLSMHGYISGDSDSDDDDNNNLSDDNAKPERKNRRGQRARRQLWEKKYGQGAKHIVSGSGSNSNDRNTGWDKRKGAVENPRDRFARRNGRADRNAKMTGSNMMPIGDGKKGGDGVEKKDVPLHPSWEAAKLAKEKKQTATFAGTKISFA